MNYRTLKCGKSVMAVGMEGCLMDIREKLEECNYCTYMECSYYVELKHKESELLDE